MLLSSLANGSLEDKAWVLHFLRCFQLFWRYEVTILWSQTGKSVPYLSCYSSLSFYSTKALYPQSQAAEGALQLQTGCRI